MATTWAVDSNTNPTSSSTSTWTVDSNTDATPASTSTWISEVGYRSNYSLSFDGVDDYIGHTMPPTSATGSASFWIQTSSDTGGPAISWADDSEYSYFLISIGDTATGLVGNELVTILRTITNTHSRAAYSATGGDRNVLVDGNWHHVAVTGDGSNYKIYIDGVSYSINATHGDGDSGSWSNVTGLDNFDIGRTFYNGTVRKLYTGKIDDVALFDVEKTALEISSMYNSGVPTDLSNESGLIGYWKFEEGLGESVSDSSTNSNTGTISGAAWSTNTPSSIVSPSSIGRKVPTWTVDSNTDATSSSTASWTVDSNTDPTSSSTSTWTSDSNTT